MPVIFQDRWWVVHLPFVSMVEFIFLAHFPVDHLAHPVVLLLLLLFEISSHQSQLKFFCRCLSDSKSLQISRTLRCIRPDVNNDVIWMVSTHPVISKSSIPSTNPLVSIPNAPMTTGITVTFMFHCCVFQGGFSSLARSRYFLSLSLSLSLSLRLLLILLCGQPERQSLLFGWFSFLLIITRFGCLAEIR